MKKRLRPHVHNHYWATVGPSYVATPFHNPVSFLLLVDCLYLIKLEWIPSFFLNFICKLKLKNWLKEFH